MLAKPPLADRISANAQDKSLMYMSGAGGDVDDIDVDGVADEEAMATNSGFPLAFPFDLGPCPSIPPPLAKQ
jgi:hypothetical protein